MLFQFAGLRLRIPPGWGDITGELPPGSPPTLARPAGVGSIQFSLAKYQRGAKPTMGHDELKSLFIEFCQTHLLGRVEPVVLLTESNRTMCVGGVSTASGEVIAVWYISNGVDVALMTYTSLEPESRTTQEELIEARAMARSADFG